MRISRAFRTSGRAPTRSRRFSSRDGSGGSKLSANVFRAFLPQLRDWFMDSSTWGRARARPVFYRGLRLFDIDIRHGRRGNDEGERAECARCIPPCPLRAEFDSRPRCRTRGRVRVDPLMIAPLEPVSASPPREFAGCSGALTAEQPHTPHGQNINHYLSGGRLLATA